jgi:succinate dehydrogenase / fumarate reductase cytochrome b subunit
MATSSPRPYSSTLAQPAERRSLTLTGARRSYWSSSVGTKVLIAVTGLLLFAYLVLHLAGNLLVFLGPAVFNQYSYALIHNPLIVPAEIGLLAIFLLHVYKAVTNYIANKRARPVPYYRTVRRFFGWGWAGKPSRKSFASTTMLFSGLLIALFVIIHVRQFRFGPEYLVRDPATGVELRDLYRLEMETFSNLFIVAFYVFSMLVVGTHIWHGFSSAFSSLGADHPRYTPWVLRAGKVLAVLIAGGFLIIPIWAFAYGGRP